MRQWICVYALTHKKLVHCTVVCYLQSKGYKLPTWLGGVKEGRWANILAIFLLCKVTQTHCFIHVKNGYWSTLQEDPQSHLEYIKQCNLHLIYMGAGIFTESEARTEFIQYEIFGVSDLLPVEINVNKQSVRTLSAMETNTLILLMSNGTTQHQSKPTAIIKLSATVSSISQENQHAAKCTFHFH